MNSGEGNRQMRVAIFYRDALGPGGMPRETRQMAEALAARGIGVDVICYDRETETTGVSPGLRYVSYAARGRVVGTFKISAPPALSAAWSDADSRPRVVFLVGCLIPENNPIGALCRSLRVPYIVSIGDAFNPYLWEGSRGLLKRVYFVAAGRRFLSGAALLRVYSDVDVERLRARGYLESRIRVLREGIDRGEQGVAGIGFETGIRDRRSRDEGPRFGFLGRFEVRKKGLDILLAAWEMHVAGGGSGELSLAGGGDSEGERFVERRIASGRLRNARVVGYLDGPRKAEYLAGLDFLVVPSRWEGITRVAREAFALGVPLIVTENTNVQDLVREHSAGLVVDVSAASLADAFDVVERMGEEELRHMRDGARAVAGELDWARIAAQMETMVRDVVVDGYSPNGREG